MKTVVVLSQKGGSGKTTLTVHLAVCSAEQGHKTAIIDIDPQGSATRWNEIREESRRLDTIAANAGEIANYLDMAKKGGIDLALIDTAPHSNTEAAQAALLADFILIPCRPALFDLEAIASTVEIARAARKPFAVVINAAPRGKLAEEAREALESSQIEVLPVIIGQRAAYSHAVIDGRAVHEFEPDGKAAQEIDELYDDVSRRLGFPTRRAA
ncbi:ParA family partition ATPase [Nitrosospira multiformis]|uniref:Chromosome partitioning protein n=1 Tax=Nitrosospira multiformis TaxID=1231 RepID=A0A1I7IR13_9PROT|nr:ParA family partition ATPase [Nitrosospira multiformis]SFU75356.1 chromosome partitioning protein [Nitrosospira multiformis]